MLLRSALLSRHGFVHGFSTRLGGVSEGPYRELNLARTVGDDASAVEENYRRFAAAVGYDASRLFEVNQVHGRAVVTPGPSDDVSALREQPADALVATRAGASVGVRTADCVPILLADPSSGVVAAVHAGWRGTVAGVVDAALDAMEAHGAVAARCVAAIGPHIGPGAFEVGEEVAREIAAAAPGVDVIDRSRSRPLANLEAVVRLQLRVRGIGDDRVERVPGCTFTDEARFHSFRRDGKASGRMLSVVAAR